MKKSYSAVLLLAFVAFFFNPFISKSYADGANQVIGLYVKAFQVNNWLNYQSQTDIYPHATSYYDDLEDHYEHDQLMFDTIASGLDS